MNIDQETFLHVTELMRKELQRAGIDTVASIKVRKTESTKGVAARLARWEKLSIEAYCDHFLGLDEGPQFWFGFRSPKQAAILALIRQLPETYSPAEVTDDDGAYVGSSDVWKINEDAVSRIWHHEGLSYELEEDRFYFGRFLGRENRDRLVAQGAAFLLDVIFFVDPMPGQLGEILRQENPTQYRRLVLARRGQGLFRERVESLWGSACAVYGCGAREVLRASHIKPWRDSDNGQRLDGNNGLLLSATLDALFDRGLISFADDGKIIISAQLSDVDANKLGLQNLALNPKFPLNTHQQAFLADHRANIFR